ncbi:MAG: endolytic transglycosylase MltG [Arachnia sp.]
MSPQFVDNDKPNWAKIAYHARSGFAVALSLAVLVGGGWFVYSKISEAWTAYRTADDYIGEGIDDVEVVIPLGANITQIGDVLVEHDVIRSVATFRDEALANEESDQIQAGRYALKTQIPAKTALEMLLDPANQVVTNVTLREGLALSQELSILSEEFEVSTEDLKAALESTDLGLPGYANGNAEGFLFPETYRISEPLVPGTLYSTQVSQFKTVAEEIGLADRAAALGRSEYELVIVASMIEKEAATPEDRPKVAAVIYNRLDAGMKLQFDSTVHYALQDFSRVTTTEADRATESVYNTYLHEGLPWGPISNPGRAALEAAANPADISAMFFTAVNLDTGETLFADTAEEHAENVKKFQAWCQAHQGRCT